jgi:predicted amidohydrolase YtcJ
VTLRLDALLRGSFVTFDDARPHLHALGVLHGRIVAVDDDAIALPAKVSHDLSAGVGFPGFHDAHAHTSGFGRALGELDLSTPPIASLDELYAAVGRLAISLPEGALVVGRGYDQNKLGGAHPTRLGLDAVAGGRPVWLQHTSGHMCVLNSEALVRAGSDVDAQIDGGRVVRDEAGAPTGLLEERAQELARRLAVPRSVASIAEAIGRAHDVYVREGLTSVCDAGIAGGWIGESPAELAGYQQARDEGRLVVRTTAMVAADVLHPMPRHDADLATRSMDAGARTGLGDDLLRIGAMKVFSDGSLIGRTCWMTHGFEDDPDNLGYPQRDPDELRTQIIQAHLAGWQVATHAIGDAAVRFVLDAYESALAQLPRPDHRHRIEHCGVTTPESLARIAQLGVIPVPQGRFIGELGDGMLAALGEHRAGDTYRLASFLRAGIVLPGSSDRPVVDGRPLLGIADMVSRRTESGQPFSESEALTVEEALRCYSIGSAIATRTERDRGTLGVGKLADVVVLGVDPRELRRDAAAIAEVPVLATFIGGELAFSR